MGKKKAAPATKKSERGKAKEFSFPCITFDQGGHKLSVFACSAKTLWSVVQINQRKEDSEKGYQRAVSPSRAAAIAKFIDANNVIPTSVLISFDKAKIKDGKIIVENVQDAGWVIDGQHRLAGANEANKDILLPVVAFTDLDVTNQIKCFVTINKEQKGVPSSLYLELMKQIPGKRNETEEAKERAVDLAHILKLDESSPFFGRIVSTVSPKKGELSLTNFVRKVHPMVRPNGRLAIYNDEERAGILSNYYKGLESNFPSIYRDSESIFFKTVGFGALMTALPVFLDVTLQSHGSFQVADTARTFKSINYFDFGNWSRIGAGNAAENIAAEDLRQELVSSVQTKSAAGKIRL